MVLKVFGCLGALGRREGRRAMVSPVGMPLAAVVLFAAAVIAAVVAVIGSAGAITCHLAS